MCGIAGEVGHATIVQTNTQQVEKMIQALTHRGPDEQAFDAYSVWYTELMVHLGMCRLSIIDREHGKQPFGDKCKVFFNGEIYNHRDIRRTIERQADDLHTDCDSEVVAAAYECWGTECVTEFNGMFAIAIWDEEGQVLHLMRDHIGKKPLYYYHDHNTGTFLFASEIKGILANPLYRKQVNLQGLYQYLCMQYIPEPETAFYGIKCVPPSSILTFDPGDNRLVIQKYQPLGYRWFEAGYVKDDCTKLTSQIVTDAVQARLESEVPLGVYLSGGIDSAIVTAIASLSLSEPLHTFTMGFLEPEFNEIPSAQHVADMYKTNHHTEIVKTVDLRNMAFEIAHQYDQPFGDCSAIPTMLLARLSKKYITVALCGDGGDEVFGGYPRYWVCNDFNDYWKFMTVFPPEVRREMWTDDVGAWIAAHDYVDSYMPTVDAAGAMHSDIHTYLLNDIIVKMERASMAASVEARCPFLDHRVVGLGYDMPVEMKLGNNQGKLALREAFKDILPPEVLNLPKRGFSVPVNAWFRSSEGIFLMSETMMRPGTWEGLPINPDMMGKLVTWHLSGEKSIGHGLWLLVQLAIWYREHFL